MSRKHRRRPDPEDRPRRSDPILLAVDLPRLDSPTVWRALTSQVRRTSKVRRT